MTWAELQSGGVLGTHHLGLFVLSGLLLNVTPGPDTLYIVGRSSAQGGKAGSVAALGIGTGALVHVCAAALGLSALLAASATAFTAVKLVGAAYLIYVGISLIRARASTAGPAELPRANFRGIFLQGFLTNVLNPKVALFFLAFLPQFVSVDAPSKAVAFLLLGAIFDFNGTLWNLLVAWSTARLSARITASRRITPWLNRCIGTLFVGLGLRIAFGHER
jgi:threonine/homoserine/homoserine lactone efflux protein